MTDSKPSRRARTSLVGASLLAGVLLAGCSSASTGEDTDGPIKVGSLLDETGPLAIYGTPMAQATELAIADLNENGGVLGRDVELVSYDTQSDDGKYADLANKLSLQDDVDVVMGGIASSSREAIRPLLARNQELYFYNAAYEGGVCDRNTFITGSSLDQSISALVPYAMDKFGSKVYTVAADYNFGQIGAQWIEKFATDAGGSVVGSDLVPLNNSDFSSIINEIQATKPDIVGSMLVGTNHVAFYRAFAAAGLNETIPIVSESFGLGNEQEILSAKESKNVYVGAAYAAALDTPENAEFIELWQSKYPDSEPTSLAVDVWNGIHLWAEGVEKAGTLDREKVIEALESGISFDGPAGAISIDGQTHQAVMDISITQTNDKSGFDVLETESQIQPEFVQSVCDLEENPNETRQFTPSD